MSLVFLKDVSEHHKVYSYDGSFVDVYYDNHDDSYEVHLDGSVVWVYHSHAVKLHPALMLLLDAELPCFKLFRKRDRGDYQFRISYHGIQYSVVKAGEDFNGNINDCLYELGIMDDESGDWSCQGYDTLEEIIEIIS